ncbi:MAG: DUF4037 domain-containing protein [Ruminococcaceae bacterium]|nr:DUF4037 domain-containing protein [Oscillospiraceae bacterium]
MKGIELCRAFYEEIGAPILKEQFAEVLPSLAIGIAGSGSECFGFDDEVSRDHDFEPAFCIFVPDSLDRKTEFNLERAYAKLPKEFKGFKRQRLAAVGGGRHGVIKIGDFFESKTGRRDGELTLGDWLTLPENSLFEATNGEIFFDNPGEITKIREKLSYFPSDIRLKKLAGHLLLMGQAGQYNYSRCISRGDTAAAQLAVIEFAKSAMNVSFLFHKKYMPYYKWRFRALRGLGETQLAESLEFLISSDNKSPNKKAQIIENICQKAGEMLAGQGLCEKACGEMEALAYAVNDKIEDNKIRNMNILSAV